MEKIKALIGFKLEYEGQSWIVDLAIWVNRKTGKGELRCYRVEGDITSPLLAEALQNKAEAEALNLIIMGNVLSPNKGNN
jgi:hypothetical protein